MNGWPKVCLKRKSSCGPFLYFLKDACMDYKEEIYVTIPEASRLHFGTIIPIIVIAFSMENITNLLLGSQQIYQANMIKFSARLL
jgi:hypothetical protein